MTLTFKDFIAGWGAGVCGILVGHPADTVKVRQQVLRRAGIFKILIKTVKNEGVLGLYRGMSFPLLLAGVQNSVFFGVYGNTLRVLQNVQGADVNRRSCGEGSRPNRHWHINVYFAGFIAGFVHTFLACPVELIKIKIQASGDLTKDERHRMKECIRKIYQHSGLRGFYRGFVATLYRDVPSYGLYVLFYEHLLKIGRDPSDRRSEYSIFQQLFAGGLAGTITWVSVTPFDVLKSRIQADDVIRPKYKGLTDCIIKSYKADGFHVFGRGFWVHVIRGFPVNAATFVGYEWCLKVYKHLE
ncbi:Congested-like trachea protein [Gryllus bimaculatus]|nr:Congested-like trachea protein [Gryllus bimaculatus]